MALRIVIIAELIVIIAGIFCHTMNKRKLSLIIFIVVTLLNVLIFFKRNYFVYYSYQSVESLYRPCNTACEKQWKKLVNDYPDSQLLAAGKVLNTYLDKSDSSTINKIIHIGNFLRNSFEKQQGNPSLNLQLKVPFEQFQMLKANPQEKLWCGNWSNMFTYFCWSKGIVCRIVEIIKPRDHHVLNECYLPETGSWVMVDLTNNILSTKNEKGEWLNLIDFLNATERKSSILRYYTFNDSVRSDSYSLTQPGITSYYQKSYPLYYYYRNNLKNIYSLTERFKRYVLPETWYSIFTPSEKPKNNFAYFIKSAAICVWLISALALLFFRKKYLTK